MKISIEGPQGELASHPERAFDALADIAEADGAERDDWVEKALRGAGATSRSLPVSRAPTYQPARDVVAEIDRIHAILAQSIRQELMDYVDRMADDATFDEFMSG